MSYNVTALDTAGQWATARPAPDRPARVTRLAVVTNHQGQVELGALRRGDPQHTAPGAAETAARRLGRRLRRGCCLPAIPAVRHPLPLGLRDLYTAEYRPAEGVVHYHWPGRTWTRSLENFDPDSIQILLGTA